MNFSLNIILKNTNNMLLARCYFFILLFSIALGHQSFAQCSVDNTCAGPYANVVIGEVSGDASQSDGCEDGIVEIIGPPGTMIGCMVITNTEWAILIPPGTMIPGDGVYFIGCSASTTNNCGVGNPGQSGLIGGMMTAGEGGGNEGDWNSDLIMEFDFDVCDIANAKYYDPAATGFTLDNPGTQGLNGDGDQVFLFLADGTPWDGIIWDGGATGGSDHVSVSSGSAYTLGDNDGNGFINDNAASVPGGRGDGNNATAVPILPTDDACPCNTTADPGTFTIPAFTAGNTADLWFEFTTSDHVGCNTSFIRGPLAGMGSGGNPSHTDGLITSTTLDATGQPTDNGGGVLTGTTGDAFNPSTFTPTACAADDQAIATEWGYTDHPTPGQPNNDPAFVFYADQTVLCSTTETVNFTVEIYNYQQVSDGSIDFAIGASSGNANNETGSLVDFNGVQQGYDSYTINGETTIMEVAISSWNPGNNTVTLVWDDWSNTNGTGGNPATQSNPNECYETFTFNILTVEDLALTQATIDCEAGDSPPGAINVANFVTGGSNLSYELFDLFTGAPVSVSSNTSGTFLLTADVGAGPYQVVVTDGSGCSSSVTLDILDNCEAPPVCPTNLDNDGTTADDNVCPGDVVELCLNGENLPAGGTICWYATEDGTDPITPDPANATVTIGATATQIACVDIPNSLMTIMIDEAQIVYSGISGNYFAAIDMNGDGNPDVNSLNVGPVNIASAAGTNIEFCVSLAEDDDVANQDWDNSADQDFTHFDYSIDAGASMPAIWVESDAAFGSNNGEPAIDTDFDGTGDGSAITNTFTQYCTTISIPAGAMNIEFPITISLDDGDEDIAFDDITVSSSPGGSGDLFILDFDSNITGFTTSVPQFSDTNEDFFGVVGETTPPDCFLYTIPDLCDQSPATITIEPLISPIDPNCTGADFNYIGATSEFTVDCPSASITGAFDVCEADAAGGVDIPVTITGGTGPMYDVIYAIDGVAQPGISITTTGDINIPAPTDGEVKVTLVSISDAGGSMCDGTVGTDEICVNIRPTEELTIESSTQPTNCMPCDGTVTFNFSGASPLATGNNYDIDYTVDGVLFSLGSVSLPFTLTGACPGMYDIVGASDDSGCMATVTSNSQILTAPSGTPLTVTAQPAAVCDDGSIDIDLTSDVTFDPVFDAADFQFFTVNPTTLPPGALTNSPPLITSTTISGVTMNQTIFAQFTDPVTGCTSVASVNIVVDPNACPTCPDLTTIPDADLLLGVTESVCSDVGGVLMPAGGVLTAPTPGCPAGSTIQYSLNGGPFQDDLPMYSQNSMQTINVRCSCDIDPTVFSDPPVQTVTDPGVCPVAPTTVCDCDLFPNSYQINVAAIGGPADYTLIYVLVDNDNGNTVLQDNQTGMFTGVPDNTNYTVYAFNVLNTEVALFTGAIPLTIATGDPIQLGTLINAATGDEFCYTLAETTLNEDCECTTPLISIDKNNITNTDDTQIVTPGGTASFSIEICNISTEPLCDLTVTESASIPGLNLSGCEMSQADLLVLVQANGNDQLDPDECINFTCAVPNVEADFVNTMTVQGIGCDSGIPVTDSDDSDVILGCPDLTGEFPPQANVTAQSMCVAIGSSVQLNGGQIKDPVESCRPTSLTACPPGSHIEYSMDGGDTWQTTLPDYDQIVPMEITTRCVCNTDPSVMTETCVVTTMPGTCPDPVANVCDCTDLINPFTINAVALGGGADYTLLYVLVDDDNGNTILQNNTTGMFMAVPDNTNYSVYAFNVLTMELPAFTGALPATIAAGDPILMMTAPFDTFCYEQAVTTYNEDCGCCPVLTDATIVPQANIQSNSICTSIGGGGLDIDGGVIAAPVATCGGGTPATCPDGSTLEYSIDGGPWQTDIPVYVQNTALSIQTRCICDTDPTNVIVGCTVVTEPGVCMDCPPDLDTFVPGEAVIDFESACVTDGTLAGGLISPPAVNCPVGSTTEYLITNSVGVVSDWSTTVPTYDQNDPITIQTRCTCDADGSATVPSTGVTTIPGVCPETPANVCDCSMPSAPLTINKIAVNGNQPDYSIVYSLLEEGTTNFIFSDPMGGVASFPNLVDGVDYQFCAYNVLTDELPDFIALLVDAAAHEDAADGQFFMADGVTEFCYTATCEIINENCGCCIANAGDQSTDSCTSFCEGDPAAMVTVDIEFALDQTSLATEGPIPGTEYALFVTDASGKIISLAGNQTISAPVQNLSFPVDVSIFAPGAYCIHGVNIDLSDPDLNATTLVDFVDLNITSLGNLLTESDGSLSIDDATVCGDVNVDNCTPFTITEAITFDAVAICRDLIEISAEGDLAGTSYFIEVTNITGGSGTYTVDVGGAPNLVGNIYGPFNHTGLGTGVVTVTVTDDNSTNPTGCVDCEATAEVIETICAETVCNCDASPNGGSILAQSTGYNAIDHCMVYTITKPDGTIEVNETGFYDELPDGDYTVCAFNVLTADKPGFIAALTSSVAVEMAAALDASFDAFCYDGLCYEETVECFPDPTLADVKLECTLLGGNVSLSSLFTATTTPGGIFTLAADSPAGATINGGNTLNFSAPGCYHVEYTVGDCPLTDDAFICVPQLPEPSFSIQDQVCFSAGDNPATHVYTPKLNVTPVGDVTWDIDASSTASGSVAANGDVTVTGTGILMICMTEEISYAICGTNPAGSCEATFCQQITITDGTAQDASFTISAQDQCPGTEITLTPMVDGGEFSGDGVTDNGLGTGATVTIPADCSSIDVTYTLNDPNGCTSSDTQTVFGDRNDPVIISTAVSNLILECNDPTNNNEMLIADWLAANGGATADDDCTVTWEFDLVAETDNCSNTGTGTYRFTVTDQCGNFASIEADIIINDNEDPVVVPPAPLELSCTELSETVDPSLLIKEFCEGATATDDCDTEVLITHDFTGTLLDLCTAGTITINFTATDNCGNTHTLPSTITVTPDALAPVFVTEPADLTLDCGDINETTAITIEGWLNSVTISDACDTDPVLTHNYTEESLDLCEVAIINNRSTFTVIWTATDACGNTDTRSAVLTITPDTAPPVFDTEPADLTLDCGDINETTAVTIEGWLNSVTISDICDTDPVLTHDYTQETLDLCTAADSPITVTWTATDACGNMDTRTAVLTITPDTAPPIFNTEPADLTLDCGDINETTAVTIEGWLNNVTISDICDTDPVLTHDYTQETLDLCTAAGSPITVTWTATDACGNTDTRTAVLTITPDTAPPIFDTEPADLTLDCGDINETTVVTIEGWLNSVTISDACDTDPVLTHNYTEESLDLCDVAIINNRSSFTVIWTATDACGNTDTRSAVLTITPDTAPPVFDTEPADLTLDCGDINETTAVTIEGWLNNVTISDACDTDPVLTHDFTTETLDVCTAAGSPITVTWTAIDACGNMDTRTAVLTITPDTAPPVFDTEPADLTLDCGDINETTAVTIEGWLNNVTISDACDTDPVLTHDFTTETLDVCTAAGSPFTITWTATDACGNTDTRTAVLTITPDTAPPMFDVEPTDLTLDCGEINETTAITIEGWLNEVQVTDLCDTDPVLTHNFNTQTLDLCTAAGSPISVTWTATDACGNTDTRSAILTITPDVAPPMFDVEPMDIVLDCGDISETTAVTIEGWLNAVEISDICDTDPVLTHDYTTEVLDVCTAAGSPITVTWTATDACGNTDTRTATLTITPDSAPPTFDVEPADLTLSCAEINENVAVTIEGWLNDVQISDACDTDPILVHDFTTQNLDVCTAAGSPITVTWTASDACGNVDTRTAVLTIIPDVTPPILSCTGLTTSGNTPFYDCEGDISWDHPLATDDCHVAIYTYTITDPDGTVNGPFDLTGAIASGNLATSFDFEEGVSIVTYYAEDDCGNPSTCSFDVSVGDSVNPFFLDCPADLFVGNDPDECSAKVNWEVPVAWDNCDIPANPDQIELDTSLIVSQLVGTHNGNAYDDIQSGQVIPVGNYLIGYLVVDTDGNTDTCSFNLTVWDTQDPILMAGIPEDVTLSCEIRLDTFVMMPHHVMDNCVEDPTIENTLVSTRVMDPEVCEYYSYQDTFFYTVTDSVQTLPDGSPKVNQMIWKWVVTWIDTTAPQIIPPPDTLIETCTFDVEIVKSVVQVDSIQVDSLVAVGDDWVIVTVQLKKDSIVCDTIFTPIPISDRMNGLPIVNDNCAPDSLFVLEKPFLTFRDSIEFLCKGDKSAIVHRWWIAEDPCGNIDSAEQLITILADPNPPVLDVYAKDTISLGPDGHVIITRDDLVKSVFNACFADETLITVEITPNYFNCSDIGVHNVLVSATDPCSSQTAYEYVEVTIVDNIACLKLSSQFSAYTIDNQS